MINSQLLNFTLSSLIVHKKKNLFFFFILTLLVFLSSSIFLISTALENQNKQLIHSLPDMIVQNQLGGKQRDISQKVLFYLLNIKGVQSAIPRVWGYYYFYKKNSYFAIVGLDKFDYNYNTYLSSIQQKLQPNSMIIGNGVKKILKEAYYEKYFNFLTPTKKVITLNIAATLPKESSLYSYDTIVMDIKHARAILGIKPNYFSDIALKIPNKDEIDTIAAKIHLQYPQFIILTKEKLLAKYKNIFNYKGGIFLVVFLLTLFTFFMIVTDKLTTLSSSEQKEIAILKALGWSIEDIIKQKFQESFIIAFFAYLFGIMFALIYVFIFHAPLLSAVFTGISTYTPPFNLSFDFDPSALILGFFITIPIFIAGVIIPTWKIAVMEVDEVLR